MIRMKQAGLAGALAFGLALAVGPGASAGEFLAAGPVIPSGAGFTEAVAAGELQDQRAGDFETNLLTNQEQTATQTGNTVEGHSGDVIIDESAMDGLHGVGQIVANSGALGVAQGGITMNVYLNSGPPPAAP